MTESHRRQPPPEPVRSSAPEARRPGDALTVGALAELVGVTVRTLHHYDEVGLVRPTERSRSGYRLYSPDDVTRLQHVVVYRRLGFPLEEIASLLDGSEPVAVHLERQREAVLSRLDELQGLVLAIESALEKERSGMKLTKQEQKELFGDGFSEDYADEAEQRWGDTDAWKQSQSRTATYTKADWEAVKAEADGINAAFVAALQGGEPATGERAMDLAEQHRTHIGRWFYDCPPAMHAGLGQMYVADPRFAATYEDQAPGLAAYVRDAVVANAARQQG